MSSISTLNVNCYPARRGILPSAATHSHLPPECFTIDAFGFRSTQNLSQKHKLYHKKISRVTRIPATEEVAQVHEEDISTANEGHDAVNNISDPIEYIRTLLRTMGDGRESVSAYDTAWVAMINGGDGPQFPASVEWIVENQLGDGSWGDDRLFCIYDRLVNTIACVVALATWNLHPHNLTKGVTYIKENLDKLTNGNAVHMTCGFELVFPALLERAKALGIQDLPYHAPVIQEIYHTREQKLKKTPREMMHKVETSLLFSLEGLEDLDLEWDKLLKLQTPDGSFLTSVSSTAFAFINTGDHKCLQFITKTLQTFNGGAPNTYPVDLFGRLWAVDRLHRLGISRFFPSEIASCLDYIYKYWSDKGIFSVRESKFCDIDDTSMGVRLFRMHGYNVDPNVLRNFKHGENFSCYGGQMYESPSPIFNLYRASQIRFPGEEILEQANDFAYKFLQQKLAANQLVLDKWFRSEHLTDEIRVGLEMPWYAALPRVEARYYIQHYGGSSDVWIGKTLYRLPEICNDKYRELAVKDFKICQQQHQLEWISIQEWHNDEELVGVTRKEVLVAYFLATATIFEQERTKERIAWAKTQILIASFFNKGTETTTSLQLQPFLSELRNTNGLKFNNTFNWIREEDGFVFASLTRFLAGFDRYTSYQLKNAWIVWLTKLQQGEGDSGADAELLTNTLNICAGHIAFKEEILSSNEYTTLSNLTTKICRQLSQIQREKLEEQTKTEKCRIENKEVEQDMQALVKLVLEKSAGLHRNVKNTFLQVAQTYYYTAFYGVETIDTHIFKVLFEPVE